MPCGGIHIDIWPVQAVKSKSSHQATPLDWTVGTGSLKLTVVTQTIYSWLLTVLNIKRYCNLGAMQVTSLVHSFCTTSVCAIHPCYYILYQVFTPYPVGTSAKLQRQKIASTKNKSDGFPNQGKCTLNIRRQADCHEGLQTYLTTDSIVHWNVLLILLGMCNHK